MKTIRNLTLVFFVLSFILIVIRAINHLRLDHGETTSMWYMILINLFFALAVSFTIIDRQKEEKGNKAIWMYRFMWVIPVILIVRVVLEVIYV
ncbi:hypothetical protein [Alkalicoccobacillus murimartini]|uniref:Preprotein translocase subunit SecG n=1 Tax=Alkalicoccobacillus murimartini TaxID=171685 RepID=A0ABT9YHZ7_9BACI|nr:hypothetical protein [Alkalicoccobacillus murimartini]MDQ0207486.1 preprotein translocase subunit SecG [Alkalicoccobacillus murimartini]